MMLAATSPTSTNAHPSSYIVAAAAPTTATTNTTSDATPALSDIKLICTQRKKKTKRYTYLVFEESQLISSPTEQPCIEVIRKSNCSSPLLTFSLDDCISFEYFDTVKSDFQSFIYAYFESFTISIFFTEENFEKKALIVKHLDYMYQTKIQKDIDITTNASQDANQSQSTMTTQQQQQQQQQQQTPILPCPSVTEQILHTFDINLIPDGRIIDRDHVLVGPARLYFTTTDMYVASLNCSRSDLKITITNQCPSKDRAILCIPYFTIKNYGNRSNIFLIELGKSNYGNGEIHMKCSSSSLASTIHLLVSPVIEERPLVLSSAFRNQLLTSKRIEKSKNIQPPIQLNNETSNPTVTDSPLPFLRPNTAENNSTDAQTNGSTTHEMKSRLLMGFFRTLSKNVSNLRQSASFHHHNHSSEQSSTLKTSFSSKDKSVVINMHDKILHSDQHQIILPESDKKVDPSSTVNSMTTKISEQAVVTSASMSPINAQKQETTMGTYIDMGPTVPKTNQSEEKEDEDAVSVEHSTATVDVGVNTMISLSPHVRSAIIVGNSVHLIADDKTLFPIGQRSFTSPASVMHPFKNQLNGPTMTNAQTISSDLITSCPNSSSSIHQANSVSNSQQSLFLSYAFVTFNNNDLIANDESERATSPPLDGFTLDRRLNSDLSLMSSPSQQQQQQQQQQQGSIIYPLDGASSSSTGHIFRALSVSANNMGDTSSGSLRTPRGSIIFLDDHLNDPAATYLLGAPSSLNDEALQTNLSRLSSFNLAPSISRPHLSHIDEEKTLPNDAYALLDHSPSEDFPQSPSPLSSPNPRFTMPEKSLNYVDLLLPVLSNNNNNETAENNEPPPQQQQQQQQVNGSDDRNDETNDSEEQEREKNEFSSTKLYTNIDFHQTQRRDRIVQLAANAKMEDRAPPFVL